MRTDPTLIVLENAFHVNFQLNLQWYRVSCPLSCMINGTCMIHMSLEVIGHVTNMTVVILFTLSDQYLSYLKLIELVSIFNQNKTFFF